MILFASIGYGMHRENQGPQYLISDEFAAQCEDRYQSVVLSRPLFQALVINAHDDKGRNKEPLNELVKRVNEKKIKVDTNIVYLSQKEFFGGLIAYVKKSAPHMEGPICPIFNVIINNWKTTMTFGPNFWNPNDVSIAVYHYAENQPAVLRALNDLSSDIIRRR